MFLIEDSNIYLTRGDDAELEVEPVTDAGEVYELAAGDVLTLTVRERPVTDSAVLFAVSGVAGSTRIVLRGEDTQDVDAGRYSADIQLTTADGRRYTIWPQLEGSARYTPNNFKNFIIMPEVTTP